MHTLRIPVAPAEREEFIRIRRIATLDAEFSRDLHLRFFRAFASLGFDDHGWYATADLQILVTVGGHEVNQLRSKLSEMRVTLAKGDFQGFDKAKHKAEIEKQITNLKDDLEKLEEALRPFQPELNTRTS